MMQQRPEASGKDDTDSELPRPEVKNGLDKDNWMLLEGTKAILIKSIMDASPLLYRGSP